jgi:hypothetical protein
MLSITQDEIRQYVEKNIQSFHDARLNGLDALKLAKVLKKKNPYLFKAKNIVTPRHLIKAILDAYLSSQEEAILGNFLEGLAVHICTRAFNGRKSTSEGIDLEFERDNIHYIVSIKSGPNRGNSSGKTSATPTTKSFGRNLPSLHRANNHQN